MFCCSEARKVLFGFLKNRLKGNTLQGIQQFIFVDLKTADITFPTDI